MTIIPVVWPLPVLCRPVVCVAMQMDHKFNLCTSK